MTTRCWLRLAETQYHALMSHLFPGDNDEHGAVVLAGVSRAANELVLCVREIHTAKEPSDYSVGTFGHRALAPQFIHRLITRARDERLAYLAVHNHLSDREVGFSAVDLASHERGYPALLDIARGMPIGALVFGRRSIQADVWQIGKRRLSLAKAVVVGNSIRTLEPRPQRRGTRTTPEHDRQVRMLGERGQLALSKLRVAIVGLGGVGSVVAETVARLGVGRFLLIDNDRIEASNLGRIIGATRTDAMKRRLKVDVARRAILRANPRAKIASIADDVAKASVARQIRHCDYVFLAADSMRARLVVNAISNQYFVPGVQMGAKIRVAPDGSLEDAMSANRAIRPGGGCLWCNQLIDPQILARESKTDAERIAQSYGIDEPQPSVVTLNAIAVSHAVNDFLFDYLNLRPEGGHRLYEHFHSLTNRRSLVLPRVDPTCSECSPNGKRFGRADGVDLPCDAG